MKNGFKYFFGLTILIGGIAFVKYLTSQAKMLKKICVSNTSLEWRTMLGNALSAYIQGTPMPTTIPLELSLVNNSDIDVELKEIDFGLFYGNIELGSVLSTELTELKANTTSIISVTVDVDLQGDFTDILVAGISGNTEFELSGNLVLSASIYETLNYPYRLIASGSQIISEMSGECEEN